MNISVKEERGGIQVRFIECGKCRDNLGSEHRVGVGAFRYARHHTDARSPDTLPSAAGLDALRINRYHFENLKATPIG